MQCITQYMHSVFTEVDGRTEEKDKTDEEQAYKQKSRGIPHKRRVKP